MKRTQWIALYYIYTCESITQHELADKMSVKEPTIARLLNELEQNEYLTRTGSDLDRRIKSLSLTDKGERICTELIPVAEKFKSDTIDGISQEDLQILKEALNIMVKNASGKKRSLMK
jgi:Transcriptional regulators